MQEAFGIRGAGGWGLFIKGDHLMKLVGEFRAEYVMLKKGNHSVAMLDTWVTALMKAINDA
jgi:hypothetical protein